MSKYAVGYLNYFNNDMSIEIIEANNWKEALFMHSELEGDKDRQEDCGDTLEDVKHYLFDCDIAVDVIKID